MTEDAKALKRVMKKEKMNIERLKNRVRGSKALDGEEINNSFFNTNISTTRTGRFQVEETATGISTTQDITKIMDSMIPDTQMQSQEMGEQGLPEDITRSQDSTNRFKELYDSHMGAANSKQNLE